MMKIKRRTGQFVALVMSFFVTATAADVSTATDGKIYYNTIVQIQNNSTKRTLWPHPASRETPIAGQWDDSLKDHYEILVGGDDRQNNGSQLLMIQASADHAKKGPINYGDAVEICSLCTQDAQGWGSSLHNAIFPDGERRWFSNNTSRFDTINYHGEIFVARSTNSRTSDGSQVFVFTKDGDEAFVGPIAQGEKVRLRSKAALSINGKKAGENNRVWSYGDSRYGGQWHELLVGESDEGKAGNGGQDRSVQNGVFTITAVQPTTDQLKIAIARVKTHNIVNGAVEIPGVYGTYQWDENNKLPVPGLASISFTAEAISDVHIGFAELPGSTVLYEIVLGGWGNERSVIRDGSQGKELFAVEGAKLNRSSSNIKVALDKRTKTITVTGLSKPFAFTDPNFKEVVKYWALSAYNTPIKYTKIDVDIEEVVPEGFEEEESAVTENISCGSRNGELEVWGIAADRMGLEHYDQYSLSDNPWKRVDAKTDAGNALTLESVSVSSDGVLVVLDTRGRSYQYDWDKKQFSALVVGAGNENLELDIIAVGNAGNIWAVDVETKSLYQHTNLGWVLREKGIVVDVAVGVDGTVIALNDAGKPHMMKDAGKWDKMGDVVMLTVAVGNKENIWGINKDNVLMHYSNNVWAVVKDASGKPAIYYKDVAVNAAGTVFVMSADDDVYHKGEAGFAITTPATPAVLTVVGVAGAAGAAVDVARLQLSLAGETLDAPQGGKKTVGKKVAKKGAKSAKAAIKGASKAVGKPAAPKKETRSQAKKAGKGPKVVTKADKKAKKKNKKVAAVAKQKDVAKKGGKKPAPARNKKAKNVKKVGKKLSSKNPEVKMGAKKVADKKPGKKSAGKSSGSKPVGKGAGKKPAGKKAGDKVVAS